MSAMSHLKSEHLMKKTESGVKDHKLLRPALMAPLWKETVDPVTIPTNCKPNFNWEEKEGVLSEVRSQKNIGCSWAMACVDVVEAHCRIFFPWAPIPQLSHHNLLDCCPDVHNYGTKAYSDYPYYCENAYTWWSKNQVYSLTEYTHARFRDPSWNWDYRGKSIFGYGKIPAERRDVIIMHLNKYPMTASMNVYKSFVNYKPDTTYEGPNEDEYKKREFCCHFVLLVGYGTDNEDKNYWLVKNSWGTRWGDNGYARVSRDVKIGGKYLLNRISFPFVTSEELYLD